MSKKTRDPNWLFWVLESSLVRFVALTVALIAVIGTIAYLQDRRLSEIEGRLAYEPPRNYRPPKLSDYAPADFSGDSVVMKGTLYVPIYSHVYYQGGRPYSLEATLSIRNTDVRRPLYLRSVRYYDQQGQLAKTHVDTVIQLDPLQSLEFLVEHQDTGGGAGANFIVEWLATEPIEEPLVEAVMVGTAGTQGIAFITAGRSLQHADQD